MSPLKRRNCTDPSRFKNNTEVWRVWTWGKSETSSSGSEGKKKKNTSLLPLALNYLPNLITAVFCLEMTTWKICDFVPRTRRSCSGIDTFSYPHFRICESGHPWFSTDVQSGSLLLTRPLLSRRIHTKTLFPSILARLGIETFKNHQCHSC